MSFLDSAELLMLLANSVRSLSALGQSHKKTTSLDDSGYVANNIIIRVHIYR